MRISDAGKVAKLLREYETVEKLTEEFRRGSFELKSGSMGIAVSDGEVSKTEIYMIGSAAAVLQHHVEDLVLKPARRRIAERLGALGVTLEGLE